jgi:hypothetical protein
MPVTLPAGKRFPGGCQNSGLLDPQPRAQTDLRRNSPLLSLPLAIPERDAQQNERRDQNP